jgi:membrane-associated phospholipid phosphatase
MTTGDPVLDFALSLRSGLLTPFWKAVSDLNSQYAYLALIPVVYWVFSRRVGFILLVADAIGTLTAVVLKATLALPRPPNAGESVWLSTPTGAGFPSGHTTAAATTWFAIAGCERSSRLAALGAVVTAAVAFSRLYLGVHYTRDVAGGAAIGIGLGALLWARLPQIEAALARLPVERRLALVLVFPPLALLNASPEALIIIFAVTGASVGQLLADRWGWTLETGRPWRLPYYGALRVGIGLPALGILALGLGDPASVPWWEIVVRFLVLGLFVTLIGPRLFQAIESKAAHRANKAA